MHFLHIGVCPEDDIGRLAFLDATIVGDLSFVVCGPFIEDLGKECGCFNEFWIHRKRFAEVAQR
jgi:hypothetical protein